MDEIEKAKLKASPKYKSNPLIANLPDFLKNPANYESIMKEIINTLSTTCSHSELLDYAKCKNCTEKMIDRRKLLKKLGFKNPSQYLAWRKVHEEIRRSYPLVDWNSLNAMRAVEDLKK